MSLRWLYCEGGKPSTTKLNRQIAFVVSTWIVAYQTLDHTLSTELFAMYITVFTGVELAQRWQKLKYGDINDDNSEGTIRDEDRQPGRYRRAADERSGSPGESGKTARIP